MVNRCAVLWCGRDLWVETAHSHLPCFALCRKTTPNKQRAAKRYKMAMNWAHTQKKQQQAQVCVSTIYFYIYAYISTFLSTTLNFAYKLFKSFLICKTVSKFAVIYAPSLGRLCLYLLVFRRWNIAVFVAFRKLPNVLMRSFKLVDTKRVFLMQQNVATTSWEKNRPGAIHPKDTNLSLRTCNADLAFEPWFK